MYDLVATGPGPGQQWRRSIPDGKVFRLGRAPRSGWSAPWDLRISREHCDILLEGGCLLVRVLSHAVNPAYHHGQTFLEIRLHPGDEFTIGQTTFRFEAPHESAPMMPIEPEPRYTIRSETTSDGLPPDDTAPAAPPAPAAPVAAPPDPWPLEPTGAQPTGGGVPPPAAPPVSAPEASPPEGQAAAEPPGVEGSPPDERPASKETEGRMPRGGAGRGGGKPVSKPLSMPEFSPSTLGTPASADSLDPFAPADVRPEARPASGPPARSAGDGCGRTGSRFPAGPVVAAPASCAPLGTGTGHWRGQARAGATDGDEGRAAPPPEERAPRKLPDNVHFSAYAPPQVVPAARFSLSIWACMEHQREAMQERASRGGRHAEAGVKGPVPVQRGAELTVCVVLSGFQVKPATDMIHWQGEIANATFAVEASDDLEAGTHFGTARIFSGDVQTVELTFELDVVRSTEDAGDAAAAASRATAALRCTERRIRKIFVSYSRRDLPAVMQWVRGARQAGADVFLDVLKLRAGQDWERELFEQVPSHDLFCLFWSRAARRSKWVEKEWRCALTQRGCEYIQPVPLVDPQRVPPPKELSECLHFEDVQRIVMDYSRLSKSDRRAKWWLGMSVIAVVTLVALLVWALVGRS